MFSVLKVKEEKYLTNLNYRISLIKMYTGVYIYMTALSIIFENFLAFCNNLLTLFFYNGIYPNGDILGFF